MSSVYCEEVISASSIYCEEVISISSIYCEEVIFSELFGNKMCFLPSVPSSVENFVFCRRCTLKDRRKINSRKDIVLF